LPRERVVALHLVPSQEASRRCPYWIGLAAPGTASPAQLLDEPEIEALLTEAARGGVTEKGPLLLTDTSTTPPRYVYLMPVPPADLEERRTWTADLLGGIRSCAPARVGFYIAPELLVPDLALALLLDVLAELIRELAVREVYLLTGVFGLNALLNAALELKSELEGEDLAVRVFH